MTETPQDAVAEETAAEESSSGTQGSQLSSQSPSVQQHKQFPSSVPVPVHLTDTVYRSFREEFGEDEAANLQRHWGDQALGNERIVGAVLEASPRLDEIYVEHQLENGAGISADGVAHALRYVLEQSGREVSSTAALAFLKEHSELENIYNDHVDEHGNISMTGVYRMLHHIGKQRGYKYHYRGKR